MSAPEYRAELEHDLLSGRAVVRVSYRYPPARRWRRFLLVTDEGETLQSVAEAVLPAIERHASYAGDGPRRQSAAAG